MGILYNVKVKSIDEEKNTIELDIEAAHPDAMYYSDNFGFAMRMLYDSKTGDSQIGKVIDNDCLWDKNWIKKNVRGFIADCKLKEVFTSVQAMILNNGQYNYWHGEVKQSRAILELTVTDKAWMEHLSHNSRWGSTAYDTEVAYELCDPISPIIGTHSFSMDYQRDGGWVPISSNTIERGLQSWPDKIYIHKYSQKSYRRANKISHQTLTQEMMNTLLFKTVFILTRIGVKYFGTLVPHENGFGILSLSPSGKIVNGSIQYTDILTIGLAEFDLSDTTKVQILH